MIPAKATEFTHVEITTEAFFTVSRCLIQFHGSESLSTPSLLKTSLLLSPFLGRWFSTLVHSLFQLLVFPLMLHHSYLSHLQCHIPYLYVGTAKLQNSKHLKASNVYT